MGSNKDESGSKHLGRTMDKLKLTGLYVGQILNSTSGSMHLMFCMTTQRLEYTQERVKNMLLGHQMHYII
jgi:hypothetical protein